MRIVPVVAAVVAVIAAPVAAQPAQPAKVADLVARVNITHESFTLANGLRVVVHTDRKTPVVAVSIWYHVGSKDEPRGKTGFAHLFEHLMFYGSENSGGPFFAQLEAVGATDFNGTTSYDRTNYFQNVPTPALPLALFLESDRMGYLLGAVDRVKLDTQRGVVQNEKRQGDNRPYGLVDYAVSEGLLPPGHPYRHSPIGSMADLDAASLEDVRGWFRANYGPNNAVLVLAGDIDAATARPLVERYFGKIARGGTTVRYPAPVPVRTATTRQVIADAVAQPRLVRSYALPGRKDADAALTDVAATILGNGQTSRLYDALVRRERLAVSVGGYVAANEGLSMAQFEVDVADGVDPAKVEARMDAIFAEFLKDGPTADEVARVATRAVSGTIRGLEAVGGFGGKAATLAEGALYFGDPQFYRTELARYAGATPATVRAAARKWLAAGDHRITVVKGARTGGDAAVAPPAPPEPPVVTAAAATRAEAKPAVSGVPDLVFPAVERATLSNGLKVTLARRTTVPVVRVLMSFDAGLAADSREKPGTTSLMLGLLDEGAGARTGVQIAAEKERLGASIGTPSGLDRTRVSLDALKPNLAASLDLFADIVRRPQFPPAELERVRGQALAGIAQELSDPGSIARRTLPALLWGAGHPYATLGSGTLEGVRAVTRDDLVAAHARTIRPDAGEIFAVGDTTLAELVPLLEARFGDWRAPAAAKVAKLFPPVAPPAASRIVLIDRPGAGQSVIRAGVVLPVKGTDDPLALRVANDAVGGMTTARLNSDLRETKGWAYGAFSSVGDAREQLSLQVSAPVQTDRTGDSIAATLALLTAARTAKPIAAGEVEQAVASSTRSLPGDFESGGAVLSALERNALLGRADDFYTRLSDRYRALTPAQVNAAFTGAVDPAKLTWVVVGDRKLVEPQLAKLGLPVEVR